MTSRRRCLSISVAGLVLSLGLGLAMRTPGHPSQAALQSLESARMTLSRMPEKSLRDRQALQLIDQAIRAIGGETADRHPTTLIPTSKKAPV